MNGGSPTKREPRRSSDPGAGRAAPPLQTQARSPSRSFSEHRGDINGNSPPKRELLGADMDGDSPPMRERPGDDDSSPKRERLGADMDGYSPPKRERLGDDDDSPKRERLGADMDGDFPPKRKPRSSDPGAGRDAPRLQTLDRSWSRFFPEPRTDINRDSPPKRKPRRSSDPGAGRAAPPLAVREPQVLLDDPLLKNTERSPLKSKPRCSPDPGAGHPAPLPADREPRVSQDQTGDVHPSVGSQLMCHKLPPHLNIGRDATLPPDVVLMIAGYLKSRRDVENMRQTCSDWWKAIPGTMGPWLVVSRQKPAAEDRVVYLEIPLIQDVAAAVLLKKEMLVEPPAGASCWGSTIGLLAMRHGVSSGIFLLCPICSQDEILPVLPPDRMSPTSIYSCPVHPGLFGSFKQPHLALMTIAGLRGRLYCNRFVWGQPANAAGIWEPSYGTEGLRASGL